MPLRNSDSTGKNPFPSATYHVKPPMRSESIEEENEDGRSPQQIEHSNRTSRIFDTHSHMSSPDTTASVSKPPKRRLVSVTVAPVASQLRPRKSNSTGDLINLKRLQELRQRNNNTKNDNMVLQLVLPSGSQNSNNNENNNYLTATSLDDIIDNNNVKERVPNSISSQQDLYSSIGNGAYINHGYSYDLPDYGRGFPLESMPHTPVPSTSSGFNVQKPSTPEEKNRVFRKLLAKILSGMYALFIITIGIAVYVLDVIKGNDPIAETFSLYLVVIAFVFVLYLTIDISYYMKKRKEHFKQLENNVPEEIEMKETPDGNYHLNISLPEITFKNLEHHYCFDKDKHSANFYLKVGAAGFCLGHLIHSGLLLGYQIVFITSGDVGYYDCASVATLILDFVYPLYSFMLLYFIFKYSNIIINRHVALARFGIMHCLSSSLCFWIWTIFRETVESVSNHSHEEEDSDDSVESISSRRVSEVAFYKDINQPYALPLTSYNKRGAQLLTEYLNKTVRRFTEICDGDKGLKKIYQNYSPYLYPFSVEYSILVVGILFIIWQNIGSCKDREEVTCQQQQCNTPTGNDDNLESNIVIHADCHSANKGLFGGIAIMVLTVVSIILFFIAIDSSEVRSGVLVNIVTSLLIISLMTITTILSYRQITKLDVNHEHHNLLDDLLLFVCMPAFFLNGIFSIIPAILTGNSLGISLTILEVIQVLVQTPFIMDGLRRSSNTRELRRQKPGRELITFLIVCNVAMWITQTFEVKSHGLQDNRYDFYGYELWTIIGHMCVPLMMFYRFHSSVCIVDIWKFAYEPSTLPHKIPT